MPTHEQHDASQVQCFHIVPYGNKKPGMYYYFYAPLSLRSAAAKVDPKCVCCLF